METLLDVILFYEQAAYIACIVAISINLKGDTYQTWYKETVIDSADWQKECIQNTENKDSWKCKTSSNLQEGNCLKFSHKYFRCFNIVTIFISNQKQNLSF